MKNQLRWMLLSFRGRLRRSTFWWALIWVCAAFAALFAALDQTLGYASTLILYPPFLWALAALCTKRLHETAASRRFGSWRC